MAIFSYSARVDEAVVTRNQSTGRARTYLPPLTKEREAALGRVFGFVEFNIPRTPQVDELLSAIDRELNAAYGQGSLHPGENYEEYFENAVRRVEKKITAVVAERRIKLDRANVNAVFGVLYGLNIRLVSHGNAGAYLVRRTENKPAKVIDILAGMDGEADPDGRLLSSVICGEIGPHDVIVVMNKTMSETVPINDFVAATRGADPAAFGSHLRSMALASIPSAPAVGIVLRTVAAKMTDEQKENASVKNMLSREEEVARVLEPSGMPKIQNVFEKIRAGKSQSRKPFLPAIKARALGGLVDRLNRYPRRAKISLLVAVALVGVFFLSAQIISLRNTAKENAAAYAAAVREVQELSDEAESSLIYDETRSAQLIAEAKSKLETLDQKTKQRKNDYDALAERLASLQRRINHVYDVAPVAIGEIKGAAVSVALAQNAVYAASENNLYKIEGGQTQNIATFPTAAEWETANDGKLIYKLSGSTLVAVNPASPLPTALSAAEASDTRAGAFWLGRLYVVSADGMAITRLAPVTNGYAGASAWLKTAPPGPISAIAIDGSIYAAIAGHGIVEYVRGNPNQFNASNASANDDPKELFVGKNIYLLGGDGTIAEWDMTGKLLAQYAIPTEDGKATAFTVDEGTKNIYIATDTGKVMEFSIAK